MAGALVGGAFLSASLQVLFENIGSREVVEFFRRRKLNQGLLKKLEITLTSVNAVLDDAEERQIKNTHVKKWLNELKDALYDAEDVLDEISTKSLKRRLESKSRFRVSRVRKFFTSRNPFISMGINSKLEEVHGRLEHMVAQIDVLGLRQSVSDRGAMWKNETTSLLVDEFGVYGRDEEKKSLIRLLKSDDASGSHDAGGSQIGVIAIAGMGGAGKTTLAQVVYNDKEVDEWFDLKVWVCVSEEFDVFRITKTILEAVTSTASDVKDLNMVQVNLKKNLMGKKFLLVLDDVWNRNYADWERLRTPFAVGTRGSRIVVTTRNESVASIMCTAPAHRLKLLTDEDCWSVFARQAFSKGDSSTRPDLEIKGREIVKKCKGLPLAAKSLGGLLRSKSTPEEWDHVLKSEIWDLAEDESGIIPALRISYWHLPSVLKRCFAYCSIFPKDYEYTRELLVQLWMADNLLRQSGKNMTIEEVGNQLFSDLVSISFFQQSRSNELRYTMHDLIHDLAQSVSLEFCLRSEGDDSARITEKTRYLSHSQTRCNGFRKFQGIRGAKRLRTFLPLNLYPEETLDSNYEFDRFLLSNEVLRVLLPELRCLRVLSLADYRPFTELPDSIGYMELLRYLDLCRTRIKKLPASTSALYNMQTLKLSGCKSLVELPKHMHKLINLRYLFLTGANIKVMPVKMSKLINLQILTVFVVGKQRGTSIRELRQLNELHGTLSILELQNVTHPADALEASLKDKKNLEQLLLEWSTNGSRSTTERDVLEKLQPHTNLKDLTIKNYCGTTFPRWVGDESFCNIVRIRLSNCKHCTSLPPLGQLHSLKHLSVIGFDRVVTVAAEINQSGSMIKPFGSLETLRFEDMLEWEEWIPDIGDNEVGPFPSLQELYIKNCPKLTKHLPNNLPSLKKLVISKCQQLMASFPMTPSLCDMEFGYCDKFLLKELPPKLERLNLQCWSQTEDMKDTGTYLRELHVYDSLSPSCYPICNLLATLTKLQIINCGNLELPMHICCAALENLNIEDSCHSLGSFPLDIFPNLKGLTISNCNGLECLLSSREGPHDLQSLNTLMIRGCPKFLSFLEGGLHASNLTSLLIAKCKSLKSLPEQMHTLLSSLQYLLIRDCPEVFSFPEGGLPFSLISLYIYDCLKLVSNRAKWKLTTLTSLESLIISVQHEDIKSFPEEGLLPTSLEFLMFGESPHLKSLDGKGLQELTNLKKIRISRCSNIRRLADKDLPRSLSCLQIYQCPLLKQHCQRKRGKYWPRISHIPCIQIDNDIIS